MRLSEAILLGRGLMEHISWGRANACAMAMAHLAVGNVEEAASSHSGAYVKLHHEWPWIQQTRECPWCSRDMSEAEIVWHPFDAHVMQYGGMSTWYKKISLEQLCDWIRTIEPSDEPATAPEVTEREIVSVEP